MAARLLCSEVYDTPCPEGIVILSKMWFSFRRSLDMDDGGNSLDTQCALRFARPFNLVNYTKTIFVPVFEILVLR